MRNDYMIKQFALDKQKACEHRAAKARLLKNLKPEKRGFKCLVSEKLAGFFLKAGMQLEEMARTGFANDMPAMKNEDLRKLLEESTPHDLYY